MAVNIVFLSFFVFSIISGEATERPNLENLKKLILSPPRSFHAFVFYAILTVDCRALERNGVFVPSLNGIDNNFTICDLTDLSEPMTTYLSSNETTMKTGFLNPENIETFISDYYNEIEVDNSFTSMSPALHKNQNFADPLALPISSFKNFYYVGLINASGKVGYLDPISFSNSVANMFREEPVPIPPPQTLPPVLPKPPKTLHKQPPDKHLESVDENFPEPEISPVVPTSPKSVFNIKDFYKAQKENAPAPHKPVAFKNSPLNGKTRFSITSKYRLTPYYQNHFTVTNTTSNSTGNTTAPLPVYSNTLSTSVWAVIITMVTIFTVIATVLFCIIFVSSCLIPSVPLPSMTGERLMEEYNFLLENNYHTKEEVSRAKKSKNYA